MRCAIPVDYADFLHKYRVYRRRMRLSLLLLNAQVLQLEQVVLFSNVDERTS